MAFIFRKNNNKSLLRIFFLTLLAGIFAQPSCIVAADRDGDRAPRASWWTYFKVGSLLLPVAWTAGTYAKKRYHSGRNAELNVLLNGLQPVSLNTFSKWLSPPSEADIESAGQAENSQYGYGGISMDKLTDVVAYWVALERNINKDPILKKVLSPRTVHKLASRRAQHAIHKEAINQAPDSKAELVEAYQSGLKKTREEQQEQAELAEEWGNRHNIALWGTGVSVAAVVGVKGIRSVWDLEHPPQSK